MRSASSSSRRACWPARRCWSARPWFPRSRRSATRAEWGAMLGASRELLEIAPHLVVAPGLAISLLVFSFNTLGDGLRDCFDPNMQLEDGSMDLQSSTATATSSRRSPARAAFRRRDPPAVPATRDAHAWQPAVPAQTGSRVVTERMLWDADDPSLGGRPQMWFSVGRCGRFDWEKDGEPTTCSSCRPTWRTCRHRRKSSSRRWTTPASPCRSSRTIISTAIWPRTLRCRRHVSGPVHRAGAGRRGVRLP